MSNTLKFVIVGCGRISKKHVELLANNRIKKAKLVGICDLKIHKAQKYFDKFKIPFFNDSKIMITQLNPDVIVILSESGNHAKHVISLAKFGKHIIVEKPMALLTKDAEKMIKVCRDSKIKLFVVKQNRFNLPIIQLKKAIDEKRFKKITLATVRVRWSRTQDYYNQDSWRGTHKMDGGVLSNQASHHIDLLDWLMGGIKSVYGYAKTSLVKIETEDTAVVLLKFNNGALGIIEATTAIRPNDLEGSVSVLGEGGSVVIEGFAVNKIKTWEFKIKKPIDKIVAKKYSTNPMNVYGFGHEEFYNSVIKSILTKNNVSISGDQGIRTVKIINAIYKSIKTKKEIRI